jgi:hypothetical protein
MLKDIFNQSDLSQNKQLFIREKMNALQAAWGLPCRASILMLCAKPTKIKCNYS